MTRKEWLQTFLDLADKGVSSREYRKALGLRAQDLPLYVKSIPAFRGELAQIKAAEQIELHKKLDVEKKEHERRNAKSNKKTMGPRRDITAN